MSLGSADGEASPASERPGAARKAQWGFSAGSRRKGAHGSLSHVCLGRRQSPGPPSRAPDTDREGLSDPSRVTLRERAPHAGPAGPPSSTGRLWDSGPSRRREDAEGRPAWRAPVAGHTRSRVRGALRC